MTLQLTLSGEAETRLREQAADAGMDVETFAREAIEEKLDAGQARRMGLTGQQRVAELLDWAASHRPLDRIADDSRESIYAGRGE